MRQRIIDWIADNEATVKDICETYINTKKDLYILYSVEYHEDIEKQYRERVLSNICDAVCKDIGCSTEQFYETIEGTESQWILRSLD